MIPAAVVEKFPQSIRRDSAELVIRIGARRYRIAEGRDLMRLRERNAPERARMESLFHAMIREAA